MSAIDSHGVSGVVEDAYAHAISWNGAAWQPMDAVDPSGSAVTRLYGVTCPSTATCTSVGARVPATTRKTLVERLVAGT